MTTFVDVIITLRQWLGKNNLHYKDTPEVILKFPTRDAASEAQMALMHEWDLRHGSPPLASWPGEWTILGIKVRFTTDEKIVGNTWLDRYNRSWSDDHHGDGST